MGGDSQTGRSITAGGASQSGRSFTKWAEHHRVGVASRRDSPRRSDSSTASRDSPSRVEYTSAEPRCDTRSAGSSGRPPGGSTRGTASSAATDCNHTPRRTIDKTKLYEAMEKCQNCIITTLRALIG